MDLHAHAYGQNRVREPQGVLPQAAHRLDVSLPISDHEILIDVDRLNLDSTSFKQIAESVSFDPEKIKNEILKIVRERGKMHNPVTNSGGMLIGRIREVGKKYQGSLRVTPGDKIATLVSLTLTPLYLESIENVDVKTGQIKAKGYAILFESGIAALLPQDISEKVALAVLDVCGAPALVLRHAKKGDKVLLVGAGKSAKLSAAALKQEFGKNIHVACLDVSEEALKEMESLDLVDEAMNVGGRCLARELPLRHYDLVVNVANAPDTEMTSLLAVKQRGKVIFFSMATNFSKVALGAEGIGKDAELIIGNGYAEGHADLALDLDRKNPKLREYFERKYK